MREKNAPWSQAQPASNDGFVVTRKINERNRLFFLFPFSLSLALPNVSKFSRYA